MSKQLWSEVDSLPLKRFILDQGILFPARLLSIIINGFGGSNVTGVGGV